MTVVLSVLAGGDSIDDCDVLRAASTVSVLGHGLQAHSRHRSRACSSSRPTGDPAHIKPGGVPRRSACSSARSGRYPASAAASRYGGFAGLHDVLPLKLAAG
jgi:hypothetical protein